MNTRHTIQRDLLMTAIHKLDHPTAEELYTYVKQLHPAISLATVYRNLSLLVSRGQIRKVLTNNSAVRFDKTLTEHFHIICRNCGKISDVHLNSPNHMITQLSGCNGYLVEAYDLLLRGLCPSCQKDACSAPQTTP